MHLIEKITAIMGSIIIIYSVAHHWNKQTDEVIDIQKEMIKQEVELINMNKLIQGIRIDVMVIKKLMEKNHVK